MSAATVGAVEAKSLRIARGFALPLDLVTEATAIVATRGAGKSSTSAVVVEEAFAAGVQSVVFDRTGVYWGLRTNAKGDGPGLAIYVLGGPHGDVPLEAAAGKLIADLVVDSDHSFVLDLSDFSKTGAVKFAADFLEQLYDRKARSRTTTLIVMDEAHFYAPQTPRGGFKGDAARLMGAMEDVVGLGRSRGLGVVLTTQRTQSLNKAVLDLIETLLVMRMLSPRARQAVREWIQEKHEDDERGVIASLDSLPTGTAWVWSPLRGILEQVAVRRIKTFDSYATPKPGEARVEPSARRELDLGALGEEMRATAERAKANDPTELRRLIDAERKRRIDVEQELHDLRAWAADVEQVDDGPSAIDALIATYVAAKARVGYSCDLIDEARALATAPREPLATVEHLDAIWKLVQAAKDAGETLAAEVRDLAQPLAAAILRATETAEHVASRPARAGTDAREEAAARVESRLGGQQERAVVGLAPAAAASPPAAENGDLSTGARHLLATLGEHYPMRPTVGQLGLLAKRKPRGGAWNSAMKQLRDGDYVHESDGLLVLTARGADAVGAIGLPADASAIRERWRDALPAAARDLYDLLASIYPRAMSVEELAARTGRKPQGGSWNTAVATLARNGLVTRRSEGLALTTEGYGE